MPPADVQPPAGLSAADAPLLSALDTRVPRVRHTPLYHFALFVVALAMLVVPLIYLGLIGGVGYAAYWHAVHDAHLLGAGRGLRWRLVSSPACCSFSW